MNFHFLSNNQNGFAALFFVILILAVLLSIGASLALLTIQEQRMAQNVVKSAKAYYLAESGLEDAVYRIKKIKNILSSYTLSAGDGSTEVSVNSPSQNSRIVESLANVNNVFRKIETRLAIETTNPEFFYGAQAGDLGIIMENNSRIEGAGGTAGNVYSNGSVIGDNGATITGTVFVATGISQDQSHTVYNSDQIFGKENPVIDIAQSFTPAVSNTLPKVSVYVKKIGDPESRTVRILTDNSGSPSKTTLAQRTLESSLVGTSYGWVDVVFSSPPNLTQGTLYWLLIDASRNDRNYWSWGKDQNQGYASGSAKYSQDWNAGSPNWTPIAGDLNFKTFMGGQITSLENVIVSGDAFANTILNSKICGNAYYQAIDSDSLNFLNSPSNPTCSDPLSPGTAYPNSSDPPLQNMPISESNINQWKEEAASAGVLNGNLSVTSDMSFGPKKIDGNLIMTSTNKTLTLTGNIYVTGYIDVDNGSRIRCDSSFGQNSCVIITDSWAHIKNNGVFSGSGQAGSYIMILSVLNCEGIPKAGCTHHDAAMDIHNGAVGAIFYAPQGLIYLHNGVEVSELVAKKIHLDQGAVIRYEQGLINASFSAGPGASWELTGWKEIE